MIERSWKTADDHGWHDEPRSVGDKIALMHSELSEALEEHRNGKGAGEVYHVDGKPEGVPVELADVLIRIADFCGEEGIDLEIALLEKMAYNDTRPYRHGGKVI